MDVRTRSGLWHVPRQMTSRSDHLLRTKTHRCAFHHPCACDNTTHCHPLPTDEIIGFCGDRTKDRGAPYPKRPLGRVPTGAHLPHSLKRRSERRSLVRRRSSLVHQQKRKAACRKKPLGPLRSVCRPEPLARVRQDTTCRPRGAGFDQRCSCDLGRACELCAASARAPPERRAKPRDKASARGHRSIPADES